MKREPFPCSGCGLAPDILEPADGPAFGRFGLGFGRHRVMCRACDHVALGGSRREAFDLWDRVYGRFPPEPCVEPVREARARCDGADRH